MDQKELKRFTWNSWMFVGAYILMGIMGGVVFDALVTFLQASSPETAKSFAFYMGLATFLGAGIMLLAPKVGYKKLMLTLTLSAVIGLLLVSYTSNVMLANIATLAIITGVTAFDIVLPPYLATYTTPEKRAFYFSTTLWTNVTGMVLGTFLGGPIIVWRFAAKLNDSYGAAKALTANPDNLTAAQNALYIAAHKDFLLMCLVVTALSLIPIFLVKEQSSDYRTVTNKEEKQKFDWSIFKNKYIVLFLVYTALIRFGASLICPYFSVFLGKLGIDRATVSTLVTLQYAAMVIFMIIAPFIIKKLGQVATLGYLSLASIPFMLIIANGQAFGGAMVVAVGSALFLRSGFMNATNPVTNSLPMEFVSKELRPAYNSVIFVVQALCQMAAGVFTKGYLFKTNAGYSTAYYITAVLYTIACVFMLVVFTKKYNRSHEQHEEKAAA